MSDKERNHGTLPKLYSIFRGEIASLQPYGAFVKIPHTRKNGLVHKTQISKMKIDNPSEVLEVGEKVYCKVISLGEVGEEKISLSMKVVNQDNGKDLDENLIITKQEELRRKKGLPPVQDKIELGAVLNTICKKCGMKGHLTQDCFKLPGDKSYDLIPELDLESLSQPPIEREKKDKKKKGKHKKKKKNRASSTEEETSDEEDAARNKVRDRERKTTTKKKKHKKEKLVETSSDSSLEEVERKRVKRKERKETHNVVRKQDSSSSVGKRKDSSDEVDHREFKYQRKRKESYHGDRNMLEAKGGRQNESRSHDHHYKKSNHSSENDRKPLKSSKYDRNGSSYGYHQR